MIIPMLGQQGLLFSLVLILLCLRGPGAESEGSQDSKDGLKQGGDGQGVETADPHAPIQQWLQQYFNKAADDHSSSADAADQGTAGQQERPAGKFVAPWEMRRYRRPKPDPSNPSTQHCMLEERSGPPARENLVVAPVGDNFDPRVWMSHPGLANYDLVLMYYGSNADYQCDFCLEVFRAAGPKWKLAYELAHKPEWPDLIRGKKAIMVADDDLEMDTCILNRAFEVFHQYDLLLAGPSLCNSQKAYTVYKILYQRPQFTLRYTTFMEIMAPIFRMDFYQGVVVHTLHNVHTGWGLDFVWPFLLKYPKDKIAVLDDICIYHPHSSAKSGPGLYDVKAPYSQHEEQRRREAEYGLFPSEMEKLGYPFEPVKVLGGVLRPPPPPPKPLTPLERADVWLSQQLGLLYPMAVLGQTVVILVGLCLICRRRLFVRRVRTAYLERQCSVAPAPAGALPA